MLTEDALEQLALAWFQDTGWEHRFGPDIAPDGATPERADYRQVVLTGRLREALARLNPGVPDGVLDEVVQRVTTLHEPSLVQANRRFHEALVDGLPVEVDVRQGLGVLLRLIPPLVAFAAVAELAQAGFPESVRPWLTVFG
ncbi:MAG: type I restriction endonuclease, partial [Casimicrobiaceae bacterium]|nr:type I restriction endonuclease [Casimicrobiaceae bacterium]